MTPRPLIRMATAGAAALMGVGAGAAIPQANAGGATVVDPAALVDPLAGTGVGPASPGNVSEYPGASVPFGMVQFGPDTSPDRQVTTGSGYDYADSRISGFSLTHMSGDGCAIFGDVPILPVAGAVPSDPDGAVQPFSHADEHASAGNYAVGVGSGPRIGVQLTATTRTAVGAFTFPAAEAGGDDLLFKVSDSAAGSSASTVQIVGTDRLVGSVTSGDFCGIPGNYTLHFAAQFSQAFVASGTWQNDTVGVQQSCAGTQGVACGAWVRFHSPAGRSQRVLVKVGVSYVSAAGAAANLQAEDPGWNFQQVSGAATAQWNRLLGRVAVSGGSTTNRRIFYTALYHSLLFPSVFSDDDGRYIGFDHKVHRLAHGQVQYANISECDIYRTEVPLLATLVPGTTSQVVQSLLRDAAQTKGGFLPRWAVADNDAGQWDGDSADPIIADAYAYGARGFNLKRALTAMVHGATVQENALTAERQNLAQYLAQGWVPASTYDITSYPYTDGGSETLEFSVDDFSIAQMALAAGEKGEASTFERRGQNWQNLFNGATGYLAARQKDGSFPPGPAFQPSAPALLAQGVAQQGFEEGNAIQYTWMVPQNLAGLFGLMGGDQTAVAKLDTFFTQLNATRFAPYDWAGNEPTMSVPYDYDYAGEPWATQQLVRRIESQYYPLAPVNEPGNDDLGALSSWYVWSALGLYPETPGVADLAVTSPLFPKAVVTEGNGHTLTVVGRHAPDQYIQSASVAIGSGKATSWAKPWVPASAVLHGATLTVNLGSSPDKVWGSAAADAPPSFAAGAAPAVGFTTPGGSLTVVAHGSASLLLGVQEASAAASATPQSVIWRVITDAGLVMSPTSGTLHVVGGRTTVSLHVVAGNPGTYPVTFALSQGGRMLPMVTVDVLVTS